MRLGCIGFILLLLEPSLINPHEFWELIGLFRRRVLLCYLNE